MPSRRMTKTYERPEAKREEVLELNKIQTKNGLSSSKHTWWKKEGDKQDPDLRDSLLYLAHGAYVHD